MAKNTTGSRRTGNLSGKTTATGSGRRKPATTKAKTTAPKTGTTSRAKTAAAKREEAKSVAAVDPQVTGTEAADEAQTDAVPVTDSGDVPQNTVDEAEIASSVAAVDPQVSESAETEEARSSAEAAEDEGSAEPEAVPTGHTIEEEQAAVVTATDPQLAETEAATGTESLAEAAPAEDRTDTAETRRDPAPVAAAPAATSGSGGAGKALLGGIIGGALGFGAAWYLIPQTEFDTGPTDERLAALEEQVGALPGEPDLTGQMEALAAQIVALDERIGAVERQPSEDGTLQDTAIAAFQSDLDEMRGQLDARQQELADQIAAQQQTLQDMADQAQAEIEQTRAEAQAIEEDAVAAAQAATARAALAQVQGALETGAPYDAALADLTDSYDGEVPEALSASAGEGVPTLAALQADFPDAARRALRVARSEGEAGEDAGGFGAFLRSQFDVRSTAPQEGGSVDAVLSRMDAAMSSGRLNDALAEAEALPEVARAAMSDWLTAAQTRAGARDAAAQIATTLTDN